MFSNLIWGLRVGMAATVALVLSRVEATTIVPFTDLGQLAHHCDALVLARMVADREVINGDETIYRQRLTVLDQIKGDMDIGHQFEIQKWEMKVGELIRKMWGDIDLQKGKTYLLFLSKKGPDLYHPLCFSYYVFEERSMGEKSYLLPTGSEHEFILVDDLSAEPLYNYKKHELVGRLRRVITGKEPWSNKGLIAEEEVSNHPAMKVRSAPSHCTFLSSGSNFRWTDFPAEPLSIHYEASGDGVCASIPQFVGSAISTLNQNYHGINLINGGSFSGFNPNCGSAHGTSYRDFIMNTYGDSRRALIQFNDPCNEIPALQNCGGTLAVGGLFGMGSHTYKGETWFSGAYGYVVINNGVGDCYCSPDDYQNLIVHELSHSLGLGHIGSSSGMANLNPFCCNSIQTLDMACMDYSYESIFLPVTLSTFEGIPAVIGNNIHWQTSSEQNVDHFELQRSSAKTNHEFEAITSVQAVGNSEDLQEYSYLDLTSETESLYRLVVRDLDGSTQSSEIIHVERPPINLTKVFPTQVKSELFVQLAHDVGFEDSYLSVYSTHGSLVLHRKLESELSKLNLGELPTGTYLIRLLTNGSPKTFRIQRI